jgi:hypothetical protein
MRENIQLNVRDGIHRDGMYDLVLNETVYHVFAFNYNRLESNLEFLTPEEIREALTQIRQFTILDDAGGNMMETIDTLQKESELWKLFIIFALLMLLAETLILRLWK